MANFGLRYFAELRSKHKEVFWRVEVAERGFVGAAEVMHFDGGTPLSITWERRGDEFYIPVKGSEATINILCLENFHYINLFTADPRKFRVSIYRNTKLYWRGYVVADFYSENFAKPPYTVTIKAVDGFNLLSNLPFRKADGSPFSGRKSLWELIYECINLLELDVSVADWMDLFGENMVEIRSPLRQTFVEMTKLYSVYENPTYRDILELCLKPFAAQIFQSNGALHIRRAISLYNDTRPLSFYEIGALFPTGWLTAADGRSLVTHIGEPIITEATRERIESMWRGEIIIEDSSVLDIVPALRKVEVRVENRLLDNLFIQMGVFNSSNWSNPSWVTAIEPNSIKFAGEDTPTNQLCSFNGFPIESSAYISTLEFSLKARAYKYVMGFGSLTLPTKPMRAIRGVRITPSSQTQNQAQWLQEDGSWHTREHYFEESFEKEPWEAEKKIEIQGFPIAGNFQITFKQNLEAWINHNSFGDITSEYEEYFLFDNLRLNLDLGDDFQDSLSYELLVNPANNADMVITLPIADVANIPNDSLIYSLYFTDSSGKPTRIWHSKGANDYGSLVEHIIRCALRYKQLAGKRIAGETFTGVHLDMNTVLQDDKYLLAGFYVNSIDLDCLKDQFGVEFIEMPGLLTKETPPEGDDCLTVANLDFSVIDSLKCGNLLVMLTSTHDLWIYDTASKSLRELMQLRVGSNIFPADGAFVVVDGVSIMVVDYRGVAIERVEMEYSGLATYQNGKIYTLLSWADSRTGGIRSQLKILNEKSTRQITRTVSNSTMMGSVMSLVKSHNAIAINTAESCYLHDRRTNINNTITEVALGGDVISFSDYFLCENSNNSLKIYRRDTLNLSDKTLVKSISGKALFADHTLGEVAYLMGTTLSIWTYRNNTTRTIKNLAGASRALKGLFYINGELHIVRDNAIFKHII